MKEKDSRVSINPGVMGGEPCVGRRSIPLPLSQLLRMLAKGKTPFQVWGDVGGVSLQEIYDALNWAADHFKDMRKSKAQEGTG